MNKDQSTGRRKFILNTATGAAAITLGLANLSAFATSGDKSKKNLYTDLITGFDQKPLPYSYNALEDVIDTMTMEIHYSKHAAAYSKNLKDAATAEGVDTNKPLEEVLAKISKYSAKMRNNAGGHYNHEMFWQSMRPKSANNKPTGKLLQSIESAFSTYASFKDKFNEAAKNRFGSGWAWLYVDAGKTLKIGSSPNQDNPLMDISEIKGFPLLGIDVWEHAYYLKYQNKRADYIENWWNVVNWDYVQQRFEKI
jgi:Fe-Mn family superoxide dismutase